MASRKRRRSTPSNSSDSSDSSGDSMDPTNGPLCPICLNNLYLGGGGPAMACRGRHYFHRECLERHVTTAANPTCPTCRRSVDRARVRLLAYRLRSRDFDVAWTLVSTQQELFAAMGSGRSESGLVFAFDDANAPHLAIMALLRLAVSATGGAAFMGKCIERFGLDVDARVTTRARWAPSGSRADGMIPLEVVVDPRGPWRRSDPARRRRAARLLLAFAADPVQPMRLVLSRGSSGDAILDLIIAVAYDSGALFDPSNAVHAQRLDTIAMGVNAYDDDGGDGGGSGTDGS